MHRTHAGHGSIWPAEAVEAHASLDAAERASRAREDALREAARVAESLETLEAWLPTGPNGEGKDRHATIHGAKIAAAILALIDKPKGGDANEGRSGTTRETRHPATSPGVTAGASTGEDGELCKRLEDRVVWSADRLDCIPDSTAIEAAARIRSLSSRVERAEHLAYTGAISLASIDEGATRPETWKERAENRQAVFLLAKRRAEAAESEAAALREALRPFVSHYEPWMERQADGDRMCVYPVHTMGDLRRARTALEGRDNG